jgi:hypothetical protein
VRFSSILILLLGLCDCQPIEEGILRHYGGLNQLFVLSQLAKFRSPYALQAILKGGYICLASSKISAQKGEDFNGISSTICLCSQGLEVVKIHAVFAFRSFPKMPHLF